MSNEKEKSFTKTEKRILLGETTFISVGFIGVIAISILYISSISNSADAAGNMGEANKARINKFEDRYIKQMEVFNAEIKELNNRLGRIEGLLQKRTK